ncbi:MAG TPA: AAA family ATPase [Lentisphaeria bacterium]|nr:MAG: hypothetical protein A2X47_11530 [Lentisphaerae bacterium GWF2_38_69]HBM15093.1 AAA family ATPase [Lentisphaeria bacterium]
MTILAEKLDQLKQTQEAKVLYDTPKKKRDYFNKLNFDCSRAILLSGPRGTGKTSWMLSQLNKGFFLYFSADHPSIAAIPLYDLCDAAFSKGYEGVFIDEIHYAKDWSIHVKSLYDSFPKKKILVCDSSSIALRTGVGDISRRFVNMNMPLLSFREYLMLNSEQTLPTLKVFDIDKTSLTSILNSKINLLKEFNNYLTYGTRPFFLESKENYRDKLFNILHKTIESDIPFLLPNLNTNHLRLMNSVIGFLADSTVPTVNIEKMSTLWAVGREKVYQLLDAMDKVHLIRIIRKVHDYNIYSKGEKIFLYDPAMYTLFKGNIGTLREAYASAALIDSGYSLFSSKNEKECDFVANNKKIEVGGKNKSVKGADYVIKDELEIPYDNNIPLWLLGFEY